MTSDGAAEPTRGQAAPRQPRALDDPLPAPAARQRFRSRLLAWYRANGRSLPWRETDDPYHILVSEVMLQQTQVDRVLPKYHEWLSKYPTLSSLAEAPEGDVSTTWRPLGYNIRPKRLQWIAREAVARFGGDAALRRADAAVVQGARPLHGRRHSQLRVSPAGRDSRHQRRARAVPRVRRPTATRRRMRRSGTCGRCRRRWCRTSTSSTSTRR